MMANNPQTEPMADDPTPDDLPDAARAALVRVRLGAQRSQSDAGPDSVRPIVLNRVRRTVIAPGYSGPRSDDRDPQTLAATWDRVVADSGWTAQSRVARLSQYWPEIVGKANAEHAQIETFDPDTGVLAIRASSTTWAESLKLMIPILAAKIDAAVGAGVVTRIEVAGPVAPSWIHGRRRVKGRGPRDTYG